MQALFRLATLVCALAASTLAQATTYEFSYSFASAPWFTSGPLVITGSFDGVANGNLIDDLSNISVYENGVAFNNNGSLFSSYQTGKGVTLFAGVASFDGKQNNFNFTDGLFNNFQMAPARALLGGNLVYTAAVLDWPLFLYANDTGAQIAARWSVTAVPEPVTYAMLIAGLALVAFAARRRHGAGRPG